MKVRQIYECINEFAPFFTACDFDNCGLIVGDMNADVKKIGLCLDASNEMIERAFNNGVNLIITHHPVIFNPTKKIMANTPVYKLIKNDISVISAHTNLDKAIDGVNDTLVKYYELENISSPEILENLGRVGELREPISVKEYAQIIKKNLNAKAVRFYDAGIKVKKVGFVSGSGGSMMKDALSLGIDTFITGDIKHDQFVEARNIGLNLIEASHFDSEIVVLNSLKQKLNNICTDTEILILETENFVDIV